MPFTSYSNTSSCLTPANPCHFPPPESPLCRTATGAVSWKSSAGKGVLDSPHSGLGIFTAVCLLMPGSNICPCHMWKTGREMSMNRKACRKESVQSNDRSPQSILEKQKENIWTCVAPLLLFTQNLIPPPRQSSSVWQEGHKSRAYPWQGLF